MSLVYIIGAFMMLALGGYAIFGIADFGGGVWDLFASGPRANEQRQAIAKAMGPVWEANHVWIVFFMILLLSAFPKAFATLSEAMFVPFHLVLLGIILRGASFVLRSPGTNTPGGPDRLWGRIFGVASTVSPLLLGMGLAAVSSGGIRIIDGTVYAPPTESWLSPFAFGMGVFVLALASYLAAVYLAAETEGELQNDFHKRAFASGTAVAVLSVFMLWLMARTTPWLWDGFVHGISGVLLFIGAVLYILSFVFVVRKLYVLARISAAGQVIVLMLGWALAQWPYMVYPDLTFEAAKAPDATLQFMAKVVPWGMVILIPSLWLLFRVFKKEEPQADL